MLLSLNPPPLPARATYTSCYCEENIYLLAQDFTTDHLISSTWDIFAIIISNHPKTVALWNQKLARVPGQPVVWDYHAILLLRPIQQHRQAGQCETLPHNNSGAWVYDYDTCLSMPCTLEDYITGTFRDVPAQFESLFRVIPGNVYLDNFASDRSHMLVSNEHPVESGVAEGLPQTYSSPPPLYNPLIGVTAAKKGIYNNLMSSFVSMISTEDGYGEVLDRNSFIRTLC